MEQYNQFKYIYPQLPKTNISVKHINRFDNGTYLLQPNYFGVPCVVFTNGFELMVYDHWGRVLRNVSDAIDFRRLAKSKNWYVYSGTYNDKPEKTQTAGGLIFETDRFIITDVLVWDGEYLIGTTLEERLSILDTVFQFHPKAITDCYIEAFKFMYCTMHKGIFRARFYPNNFPVLYDQIVTAKYNGIIIRKKGTSLEKAFRSRGNRADLFLIRKRNNIFNFLN